MKTCFKCGTEKPLVEFYKHKEMADGHLNKCKECAKADSMKHRIDNLDSVREYDRRRGKLSERIALNIQTTKAMRQKPGYGHAHSAVSYAIRTGRIVKQPCQMCGTEIGIHAHHDDYTKPLDVMWLCVVHHKARHAFLDYMTQKEQEAA